MTRLRELSEQLRETRKGQRKGFTRALGDLLSRLFREPVSRRSIEQLMRGQ